MQVAIQFEVGVAAGQLAIEFPLSVKATTPFGAGNPAGIGIVAVNVMLVFTVEVAFRGESEIAPTVGLTV